MVDSVKEVHFNIEMDDGSYDIALGISYKCNGDIYLLIGKSSVYLDIDTANQFIEMFQLAKDKLKGRLQ